MSCHCLATCGIDTMCDLFVSLLEQTSRLALAPNNRERDKKSKKAHGDAIKTIKFFSLCEEEKKKCLYKSLYGDDKKRSGNQEKKNFSLFYNTCCRY